MQNELVKSTVPNLPVHIARSISEEGITNECPLHFHDEIELLAVQRGAKYLEAAGQNHTLMPGQVAFINSRVPHRTVSCLPAEETVILQFRTEDFTELPASSKSLRHLTRFLHNGGDVPLFIFEPDRSDCDIYRYIVQASLEQRAKRPSYDLCLRGWICLILGCLYREHILADADIRPDSRLLSHILPAVEFIDEHYPDHITLSHLAERCAVSEAYLCRQFTRATGSTFIEYLNYVRISHAERLLYRTDRSVLDIAMDVGFSSVSYFNRIFKRFRNCTPNDFRKASYLRE